MSDNFEFELRKQRRFEQIGTDNPRCPDCPQTDWRCFEATSMPRCANCHIKASIDPNNDAAKRRRFRELRTTNPHCAACDETDWRCIELHHPAGRKHDQTTVLVCANDHLILTDQQKDHPSMSKNADPFLVSLANFLRGIADMLRIIVARLIEYADELIARAEAGDQPASP